MRQETREPIEPEAKCRAGNTQSSRGRSSRMIAGGKSDGDRVDTEFAALKRQGVAATSDRAELFEQFCNRSHRILSIAFGHLETSA
jgi:hypothetical protein